MSALEQITACRKVCKYTYRLFTSATKQTNYTQHTNLLTHLHHIICYWDKSSSGNHAELWVNFTPSKSILKTIAQCISMENSNYCWVLLSLVIGVFANAWTTLLRMLNQQLTTSKGSLRGQCSLSTNNIFIILLSYFT